LLGAWNQDEGYFEGGELFGSRSILRERREDGVF
jgi:hypothetical protein